MNMIAHVRHAGIQPSLRDSINSKSSPAVNCRAIFVSPYGRSTGIGTPECPNSSRRVPLCEALGNSGAWCRSYAPPTASRRYGRLKICATTERPQRAKQIRNAALQGAHAFQRQEGGTVKMRPAPDNKDGQSAHQKPVEANICSVPVLEL